MESQSPINLCMCCIGRVRHSSFCSGVSQWLRNKHRDPIALRIIGTQRLLRYGVKVSNFLLYCRGLDEDFDQRYGTLTATVSFLANSSICQQFLKFYNCTVKLTVDVFEESIEHGRKLSTASAGRQLKSDERNCLSMPITVHRVVDLDHIVYSNTCPDEIVFRIIVKFNATSMFILSESGLDDFLEANTTDQIYLPDSTTQHPLRFPNNCVDESYLVLQDPEAEETVKSKPRGATAKWCPLETSTSTTTDDSSSDAGVTMDSQSKPRQRTFKRSRAPDNGTGDDCTGSETSVVVKPSAGGL